jgi:hypothetical protein
VKPLKLSRRKRLRIALLAVFCLLFQQLAVASYVCSVELSQATVLSDCGSGDHNGPDATYPLCQKHCDPDTSTQAEARSVNVPELGLPPVHFLPVVSSAGASRRGDSAVSPCASALPPELVHTRLLI